MQDLWGVLLIGLGGLLAGGAISTWQQQRPLSVALGACTVLAVASGVLRLGYVGG